MKKIALLAVALVQALTARAAVTSWTTNGAHYGVLTLAVAAGATNALDDSKVPGGHNFIGTLTLTYGLWTISGEPIHDYNVSWEWLQADLVVACREGRTITIRDLARYPELARQFFALKPITMRLSARLELYDASGERFATGTKPINPGLLEQAGVKETLHVPGSPRWADFFACEFPGHPSRDEIDRRNKELFEQAARARLDELRLVAVEWPEGSLQRLAQEYLRREALHEQVRLEPVVSLPPPPVRTNPLVEPPRIALERPFVPPPPATPAPPPTNRAPIVARTIRLPRPRGVAAMTNAPVSQTRNPLEPPAVPALNPFEAAGLGTHRAENPLERAARIEAEQTRLERATSAVP